MPVQLSLFDLPARHDVASKGDKRLLQLGASIVEYRFRRSRRRTIGMQVDAEGLRVAAPMYTPWREVEAFLRANEDWIEKQLLKWAGIQPGPLLHGVSGETLPLCGEPRILEVRPGRRRVETSPDGRLIIAVSDPQRRALVLDALLKWLRRYVLEALAPRAEHYAARLGLATPRLAASNARRHWATCTEGGLIRLNWRLAHLGTPLTDYVVAHEVSHLIEMNHSPRFWSWSRSCTRTGGGRAPSSSVPAPRCPRLEGIGRISFTSGGQTPPASRSDIYPAAQEDRRPR